MNTEKISVLIVEDNPINLRVLFDSLTISGFKALVAQSGEAAISQAEIAQPDIILLDVMMTGINGFETCEYLKKNKKTKDIPVIFMTALSDTVDKVRGFEVGGVDYVTKPFDKTELIARIKSHVELRKYQEKLEQSNLELLKINRELEEAQEKLEYAARTDPLTRLSNRRDIIEKLEYEKIRMKRKGSTFCLILCDIDDFKQINDTYGHNCGDFVLVSIASILRSAIREEDQVARWGGEEFLLLLTGTGIEGGKTVAEKLRENVENHCFRFEDMNLKITMTFGVAVYDNHELLIDNCIKKADQALYAGKDRGKNCVVAMSESGGKNGS